MGRVVVVSAFYLGDVAPFVRVGNLLVEAGHDVTFLAPVGFHELLAGEHFALERYPLDSSAKAMHADPQHRRLMRHPVLNVIRLSRYLMRTAFISDLPAAKDAILAAFEGADAVVAHPMMCPVVAPAAQHLGVPLIVGHLFPMLIPTETRSFPVDRHTPNFGPIGNRAAWKFFAFWSGLLFYDREFNRLRRGLGVAPMRGNSPNAWRDANQTVMLVSPDYFGAAPTDWQRVVWGGFSPWAGPPADELARDVDAFLDDGPPPVLVTLGTSAATGAGTKFATIASGLDKHGLRSLLLVGNHDNLQPVAHRPGAFVFAPLTRVVPRCRVAVVSGSLGSLAAALSAGVPVVVHPQLFDQVWHGGRVEALGVGVLARTAAAVPDAVARIDADPTYRLRAMELGAKIARPDGARVLADAVDAVLAERN